MLPVSFLLLSRIRHIDNGRGSTISGNSKGHVSLRGKGAKLLLRRIKDGSRNFGLLFLDREGVHLGAVNGSLLLESQDLRPPDGTEFLSNGHRQEQTNNVKEQGDYVYYNREDEDDGDDPGVFSQQALRFHELGALHIFSTFVQQQNGNQATTNGGEEESEYLKNGTNQGKNEVGQ